jgi:hypothetical protein
MKKNYKLQNTNYKQKSKGSNGLHKDTYRLQTMTALIKSFSGGAKSVGQWVSGSVGQLDDRQAHLGTTLIMMPRLHPETNKSQHKRFAQHIGSPRRGALAAGGQND